MVMRNPEKLVVAFCCAWSALPCAGSWVRLTPSGLPCGDSLLADRGGCRYLSYPGALLCPLSMVCSIPSCSPPGAS